MTPANKKCTFCGSMNTEKQSDFGTSIMVTPHFCLDCKSAFEWIKWGESDSHLDLPEYLKESNKTLKK